MNNGYVKIYRKFINWEWYTDVNVKILFLHLLLTANHKPHKWRGKIINPGQRVTSYSNLAAETGLTVKQVRTALNKLKSTGEVASESTNLYTVITVANWALYQSYDDTTANNKANSTASEGQTEGKQRATNKNDKNDKNIKYINIYTRACEYTENEELRKAIVEFAEFRKQSKSPLTEKAVTLLFGKLDKLAKDDNEKIDLLNQSILNGWKSIYPLKGQKGQEKQKQSDKVDLSDLSRYENVGW